MAALTTHILDTSIGQPADAVRVELTQNNEVICSAITNADGRTDKPLLTGDQLRAGQYTLQFAIGSYFRARGVLLPEPLFLDIVRIDFGVSDPMAHYHVPLLVSPFGYTTYRGS